MNTKPEQFDIDAMQAQASKASSLLSAMCNEKRLMILCRLIDGEKSVNELVDCLDAAQSTVSQHLGLLKRQGLIQVRNDGQTHFYSLAGIEAREVLGTLQSLYCEPRTKENRK